MKTRMVLVSAAFLVSIALPVLAHHSFSAEYDSNQPVSFKGVVTKLEWMNPHVWFYVDATDQNGTVAHWECEAGNPNALARNGWKKTSLKVGDQISVQGSRSKCCSNVMNARSIVLADGRKVFAGSSEDGEAVPNK